MQFGLQRDRNRAADRACELCSRSSCCCSMRQRAGNSRAERLDQHRSQCCLRFRLAASARADDIGRAPLGPFGPQAVLRAAPRLANVLVDVPAALGMLRIIGPVLRLEIVARAGDANARARNHRRVLGRLGASAGRASSDEPRAKRTEAKLTAGKAAWHEMSPSSRRRLCLAGRQCSAWVDRRPQSLPDRQRPRRQIGRAWCGDCRNIGLSATSGAIIRDATSGLAALPRVRRAGESAVNCAG